MSRPSLRAERRAELARAFASVLADLGPGGASIAAVAERAGCAPGLVHHHFRDKADLYEALLGELVSGHRARLESTPGEALDAYGEAALGLGAHSNPIAARAWVGLFAEAIGDPNLAVHVRRALDGEVARLQSAARGLGDTDALALLAYVVGCLVVGALEPRKRPGFALDGWRRLAGALRR